MNLTDPLDWIRKQSIAANGPQVKEFDPTKSHVHLQADGTLQFFPPQPVWRKHQALDLETIVNFAKRFAASKPAIWYHRDGIVCLINDNDRRERVNFKLSYSPQFVALRELEKKQILDHRAIIMLLRTTFKNCLGRHPKLIESLRSIKFNVAKAGESEIGRGKSSIGNSLKAEMAALDTLPEYVTLTVPVFDNGSLTFIVKDVECVLEPLEQQQSFQLFPVPGAMELAVTNAEAEVRKVISEGLTGDESSIPLYYGTP